MNGTQSTIVNLLVFATVAPLISALITACFGSRYMPKQKSAWFCTAVMGASFVASLAALLMWLGLEDQRPYAWLLPWIPLPGMAGKYLSLGCFVNNLTVAMMVMVTMIGTLVHLYSIGYMHGDKRFERFFAYLSLFCFSMLGIVIAPTIMQLFVFWELVGLTSYLLIGFWFEKRGPQLACKKAFVMNRIGDAGFLVGFGTLFYQLDGHLVLPGVSDAMLFGVEGAKDIMTAMGSVDMSNPPAWLTIAGIGLFCGAIGKSAQFPLHTWLPDAMEGPTPVSSIVHSATMVAAGVFLTGRIYAMLTPGAHLFIATIGCITLVMAACMALVMTDIKRVLAYSTLSQLGYMILGLGVGAWGFALFHLITHAFFKCCLFQCSGTVINAAHHEQDMTQYGGFGRKMRNTMIAYAICTLAISGAVIPILPLLHIEIGVSGYYSKDGVIAGAVNYGDVLGGWGKIFWIAPMVIAYVTAFYMARSFALTFMGKPRNEEIYEHLEEGPWQQTVPQFVLAGMAILSVPFILPWLSLLNEAAPAVPYVQPGNAHDMTHGFHVVHVGLLYGCGWLIALGGGVLMYKDGFAIADKVARLPVMKQLHTWALNKFYFDAFYDIFTVNLTKFIALVSGWIDKYLVDGLVNLAGTVTKLCAGLVGVFDNRVVDGAVNGAANFAQTTGTLLRSTQGGRVRGYVTALFAGVGVVTFLVITVVLIVR